MRTNTEMCQHDEMKTVGVITVLYLIIDEHIYTQIDLRHYQQTDLCFRFMII